MSMSRLVGITAGVSLAVWVCMPGRGVLETARGAGHSQPAERGAEDIEWRPTMGAALAESARTNRLVFAYVYDPRVFGGPLGKLILSPARIKDGFKQGPFADPHVKSFINRRFVPVVAPLDASIARTLGSSSRTAWNAPTRSCSSGRMEISS